MPPPINLAQQTVMMDLFCESRQMGYNRIAVIKTVAEERQHHEGSL
jgi:hypothetical protein